jgi:MFS family permease
VLIVSMGGVATLLSMISLVGAVFIVWTIPATTLGIVAGLIADRVWRSILACLAGISFGSFAIYAFFWGLVAAIFTGLGILLIAGAVCGMVAAIACIVEFVQTLNGSGGAHGAAQAGYYGSAPQPAIVINNNANAQVGGQVVGPAQGYGQAQPAMLAAGGASGRISVIDMGRTLPALTAQVGQVLVIGRDTGSDIRISDPRASRRHLELTLEPGGWVLRDLGATNPARILTGPSANQSVRGQVMRLPAGQLAIGDAVITLFPADGR